MVFVGECTTYLGSSVLVLYLTTYLYIKTYYVWKKKKTQKPSGFYCENCTVFLAFA